MARAIYTVLQGGSCCRCQLMLRTESSRGLRPHSVPQCIWHQPSPASGASSKQESSSVLIQPCIANQLLEKKGPSCFFGPGML